MRTKIGAPLRKAPRLRFLAWGLEEQLQRFLADSRVSRLPGSKCAKRTCAEFLKVCQARLRAGARRNLFIKKVDAVEDVEKLRAELHLPALREGKALREPHIPIVFA